MITFIIVFAFNLLWIALFGIKGYVSMYNGKVSKHFSVLVWIYSFWGIFCLIIELKLL